MAGVVVAAAALAAFAGSPPVGATDPGTTADFDGEGGPDLAIGVPGDDLRGAPDAGSVHVLFNGGDGLQGAGDVLVTENRPGVRGRAEAGDRFGHAVAAGDFDGDGRTDLAIGAPGEDLGTRRNAGVVHVLYGSGDGAFTGPGRRRLHQANARTGTSEQGDRFGAALAVGDFDGDGRADLAVGVPGEDVRRQRNAGEVDVVYGSPGGLGSDGSSRWTQGSLGIAGQPEAGDRLGGAVATGDFDGDGQDDLAAGSPGEDSIGRPDSGSVTVIYAGAGGIGGAGAESWNLGTPGVPGRPRGGDRFGASLAAGEFRAPPAIADLAVGIPGRDTTVPGTGAVALVGGSSGGLDASVSRLLTQDSPGIPGRDEAGDHFGAALGVGEVAGDVRLDLLVGVPGEDAGARVNTGAVHVFRSAGALPGTDGGILVRARPAGEREAGDRFGASVAAADFDANGFGDLVAGVPGEGRPGEPRCGAVDVFLASAGGVAGLGVTHLTRDTPGVRGACRRGDHFGFDTAA